MRIQIDDLDNELIDVLKRRMMVAEKIGIPKSSVTHLLSERNNPSLDIIIKISGAFENISTDYLIFGQENQVKPTIQHSNTLFSELDESISEDSVKDSNNKVKSIILIYENNKFEQIDNLKDWKKQ